MKKNYLWNKYGLRLQFIKSQRGGAWNWLFLPGGPGLGSESLAHLTAFLDLPGTVWHIDLPGDGSNTSENNIESFKSWPLALEDVVGALEGVILVGHSSGGMFALSLPSLEKKLSGLVLIDSAPDSSWQRCLAEMLQSSPIAELERLDKLYRAQPDNELLKKLTVAAAPYFFIKKDLQRGEQLLQELPYNYETCNWAAQHFDADYQAKWVPQELCTLIIAGSEDRMTPISLFKERADFNRAHILIKEIEKAGHFPWIENPRAVARAFSEFLARLTCPV